MVSRHQLWRVRTRLHEKRRTLNHESATLAAGGWSGHLVSAAADRHLPNAHARRLVSPGHARHFADPRRSYRPAPSRIPPRTRVRLAESPDIATPAAIGMDSPAIPDR